MSFARTAKRQIKLAIPPLIFLAVAAYFGWNATRGEHGLRTYAAREQQLVAARAALVAARTEDFRWQNKVAGLRADHLDLDALDERARVLLNLADPTEIVVPYGKNLY